MRMLISLLAIFALIMPVYAMDNNMIYAMDDVITTAGYLSIKSIDICSNVNIHIMQCFANWYFNAICCAFELICPCCHPCAYMVVQHLDCIHW